MRTTSKHYKCEKIHVRINYPHSNGKCVMNENHETWLKLTDSLTSNVTKVIQCFNRCNDKCYNYIAIDFILVFNPNKIVYWKYSGESECYKALTNIPRGFIKEVID